MIAFLFAVITYVGKLFMFVKLYTFKLQSSSFIHTTHLYAYMRLHFAPGKMVSTIKLEKK